MNMKQDKSIRAYEAIRAGLLLLFFSVSSLLSAQNTALIHAPYSMGFEASEMDDINQYWHLNDGYNPDKCKEHWVIGTAVKSEGKRSLYISYDEGETCTFDTVWNTSYT